MGSVASPITCKEMETLINILLMKKRPNQSIIVNSTKFSKNRSFKS